MTLLNLDTRFEQALHQAREPQEAYLALRDLIENTVGVRLFTVMDVAHGNMKGRRSFTCNPENYPASGWITLCDNDWFDTVIRRQQIFVANDMGSIADLFADHALIASLGCASIVNYPVVIDGKIVATINILHVAGHYTQQRVNTISGLLNTRAKTAYLTHQKLQSNRQ